MQIIPNVVPGAVMMSLTCLFPFPHVTFRKRKRRTDVVVVRGRLRLNSASGFFVFLGLIVLAVGICMATLGYWPHGETVSSARSPSSPKTFGDSAETAARDENATRDEDAANSSTSHDVRGERTKGLKV